MCGKNSVELFVGVNHCLQFDCVCVASWLSFRRNGLINFCHCHMALCIFCFFSMLQERRAQTCTVIKTCRALTWHNQPAVSLGELIKERPYKKTLYLIRKSERTAKTYLRIET